MTRPEVRRFKKTRPAVIISSDALGKLRLKIVVPVTEWKPAFADNPWHVPIKPAATNGLTKESAADALQVRSVSYERFTKKRGRVSQLEMEEIIQALGAVVEFT